MFYNSIIGHLIGSNARKSAIMQIFDKKLKKSDSLLEIGCSTGHYLDLLKNKCVSTVGLDIDKEKISQAKLKNKKTKFLHVKDQLIPFPKNEFEWILCTEVLEHIKDWKLTLNEIKRVAKKYVLLTIPLEKGMWWKAFSTIGWRKEFRHHVHELVCSDIEKEMSEFALLKKEFIFSPSITLNNFINGIEKNSMYVLYLFEKD